MKKTLVVAALVVMSILPALPASAAAKATDKAESVPAYCFFLPLLPKCIDAWKADMGSMKMDGMKMDAIKMPSFMGMGMGTSK